MPLTALRPSRRLVELVSALGGRWHGYIAMCRCPAHADHTPSLSLRQGERQILVTCFAGCRVEDVLRELRLVPVTDGAGTPPPARTTEGGNALRLWERASAIEVGSLGARYLGGRNLAPSLSDIRFLARCPYGPKPATVFGPAIIVAIREPGRMTAIQRIFLDPDTARHTRKAMLGIPARGSWRGAPAGDLLAVAEGMETAASYTALFGIPCWASLGARRLDQLAIPDRVRTLIIARDEDAEGRRAAARAVERYTVDGRTVREHGPPMPFDDWSQVLTARAKRGGGSMG